MLVNVLGRPVRISARGALRAARREASNMPRPLRLWLTVLGLLMLLGVYGAVMTIPAGTEVFGTNPAFEWGILIAAYLFLAITTSGLCLASSLGTVFGIRMFMPLERRHAILAVLCLVTAFGVIALDLHYPQRLVFGVIFSPSPFSAMWWMGVMYAIYLGFLLTETWSMFAGHARIHRAACFLASVMAIAAPSTLGAVFGVVAARPFWHGSFTPPVLIAFALPMGTALLGIAFYFVHRFRLPGFGRGTDLAIPAIRILLAGALGVNIVLAIWQTIVGLYGGVPGLFDSTMALVVGPLAPLFWIIKVGVGYLAPFVLLVLPRTRTVAGLFAASCLALGGGFVGALLFVIAGQIAPTTVSSGIAPSPYATYSPSLVEVGIVVGALAFVAFVYTLAERYLDLGEFGGHGDTLIDEAA
jgi:molybdopterin-containing oxidoreductase family membrane subunit